MSKEEEKVLGPEVTEPNVQGPNVETPEVSQDNSAPEAEIAWSNADGGSQASIAPSIEGVSDTEGISIIEKIKTDKSDEDKKFAFPKLFVKREELIEVEVEVVFDPNNGDIYSITQPGLLNTEVLSTLQVATYNFKFRPVSYDDMQKYRRQASVYDPNANELVVNRLQLRNFFLINHLRETDIVDEKGQPIELEIDENTDNLSLDSLTKIFQTTPALMDVVMTLFERKLLLLFQVSQ